MTEIIEYVRKRDFKVGFVLPPIEDETPDEYAQSMADFLPAIYTVKPSFVCPRLVVEVRQPVHGDIADTVIRICKQGVISCRVRTIYPNRPDLIDNENCSHLLYDYAIGHCIEQETVMARDILDGDEMLVHTLTLMFRSFRLDTNRLDRKSAQVRPSLKLVSDSASNVVFVR